MSYYIMTGHTIITGGVISGKDAGGVVQWWATTGPVDLLCLGPNDVFGGSIVICNNLQIQRKKVLI